MFKMYVFFNDVYETTVQSSVYSPTSLFSSFCPPSLSSSIHSVFPTFISTTLFLSSIPIPHLVLLLCLCFFFYSFLPTLLVILKSHLGIDYHLPPLHSHFSLFIPLSGWPSVLPLPLILLAGFLFIYTSSHLILALTLSFFCPSFHPYLFDACTCSHNPVSSSP